ncbi:DUF6430 domain-containing protein [Microcoleus sp. LAD1_D3]|uniref:macro domain-containing protein n=1 Tax=Microcoleus sp. LAD1_D3 TaxID=2819365 RepID=UPI002FD65F93
MSNKSVKISLYLKLITKISFPRLVNSFVSTFGLLWLFIEPATLVFPEKLNIGWLGYFGLAVLSFIFAIIQCRPRMAISKKLISPDSNIEIKIGDLFDENGHLVIGCNDTFDTEIGDIIRDSSIQGQFLTQVYRGDRSKLDADIEVALQPYHTERQEDFDKSRGKTWRYPIGTVITLSSHNKCYFLTAYGYMNNNLNIQSNTDYLMTSLNKLWKEVRQKCQGTGVAIPIIGSDLARVGLSRTELAKLIITSFIVETKRTFITKKLTVMIYVEDLDSIDFYDLQEFLESICF